MSSRAEIQRRHRQRQRLGARCYTVAFKDRLVEALIDLGWLDEAEAADPAAVALAIAGLAEAQLNQMIRLHK